MSLHFSTTLHCPALTETFSPRSAQKPGAQSLNATQDVLGSPSDGDYALSTSTGHRTSNSVRPPQDPRQTARERSQQAQANESGRQASYETSKRPAVSTSPQYDNSSQYPAAGTSSSKQPHPSRSDSYQANASAGPPESVRRGSAAQQTQSQYTDTQSLQRAQAPASSRRASGSTRTNASLSTNPPERPGQSGRDYVRSRTNESRAPAPRTHSGSKDVSGVTAALALTNIASSARSSAAQTGSRSTSFAPRQGRDLDGTAYNLVYGPDEAITDPELSKAYGVKASQRVLGTPGETEEFDDCRG